MPRPTGLGLLAVYVQLSLPQLQSSPHPASPVQPLWKLQSPCPFPMLRDRGGMASLTSRQRGEREVFSMVPSWNSPRLKDSGLRSESFKHDASTEGLISILFQSFSMSSRQTLLARAIRFTTSRRTALVNAQ